MKNKKIAIVGHSSILGDALAKRLTDSNSDYTIIAKDTLPSYDIEVNGIKYLNIEKEVCRNRRYAEQVVLSTYGMYTPESTYSRPRPQVDIVEEYKLIQQKKSKLCRNDRDWVVRKFNRLYKPIEQ